MDLMRRAGDDVNLVVFENIQPIVWITTIPFFVICLTSCAVRLYTRAFIRKPFGIDDWLMLVATILYIGQQYVAWMWTVLGGGLHITDPRVKTEDVKKISSYLFFEEFYYLLLQFFIKMTFLCFYRRTLEVSQSFKIAVLTTMVFVGLQTVGTWIFYALQCIPIQAYFHPELYPNAVCISSGLSYYLPSVANVFMDVVIYVLPIFPIWNVQASLRHRIGLISIFTLGGLTIVISTLRFIVLWQLANTDDVTYIFGSVTIVTSIEFSVAMITANMPGMYAFWRTKISKKEQSGQQFDHRDSSAARVKRRSMGATGSGSRTTNLSTHPHDGYIKTGSQEELYPMSRLDGSVDKGDVCVDTKSSVNIDDREVTHGAGL